MKTVTLRAIEPEDLDVLYEIENDLDLWTVGYSNSPYSRYLLHDYIANSQCDIYADRQLRLIVENEEGEVVGIADLNDFEPRHNRAEMGIVVRKGFRGEGYARAMVMHLLDYARSIIHLHQLLAVQSVGHHDENLGELIGYRVQIAAQGVGGGAQDGIEIVHVR